MSQLRHSQVSPSLSRNSFEISLYVPDIVNGINNQLLHQAAVCIATSTRGTRYQTSTWSIWRCFLEVLKFKDLVHGNWMVCLIDTGGQPGFRELLPILVCAWSFYLVFHFDLAQWQISGRVYQLEWGVYCTIPVWPHNTGDSSSECCYHCFCSYTTQMVGSERVDFVPRVFLGATHKDCQTNTYTLYIR